MIFKNRKIEKLYIWFLKLSFILMTLPRSIKSVSSIVYNGINVLKIAIVLVMIAIVFFKKIKITKFTKIFCIFMIYLLFMTLINSQSPIYFFKIYTFNFGMLLLGELIFKNSNKNEIILFCTRYLLIILTINFVDIILKSFFNTGFFTYYKTYILGIDNRFILYILASLINSYYLYTIENRNKLKLYFAYILGLVSLLMVWSVAAMCVVLLMGIAYFITNRKKLRINPYIVLIIILLIGVLIPFFKVHYLFKFLIVDILHKPLDLSYRVDVWNAAIKHLLNNPINIIGGFGFFDLTAAKYLAYALRIGHLHNILINLLFYSGIIGTIIYMKNIFSISGVLKKIENNTTKNVLIIAFSGLMVLMIFDTFELYAIYYYIIFVLYYSNILFNKKIDERKKNDNILVSICCITYNHGNYIEEMLESILMQKTTFKYEIIVHDDASSDNTVKILKEYEKKYPSIFKNIYQKENQYSKNGDVLGFAFKKAKGKYIAICEGDDFWCDENKLQKQFDFMEKNENCSLVVTGAKKYDDSKKSFKKKKQPYKSSRYYSTEEIIMWDGDLFATNSMFFKKSDILKMPDFYNNSLVKDYPLAIHLSLCGDVFFIKDITSVYRINVTGSWTNSMKENRVKNKEILLKKMNKMFDEINKLTHNRFITSTQYVVLKRELELLLLKKEYKKIDKKKYRILYRNGTFVSKMKNFIKIYFSFLYKA